jgi:hypothetical protein
MVCRLPPDGSMLLTKMLSLDPEAHILSPRELSPDHS